MNKSKNSFFKDMKDLEDRFFGSCSEEIPSEESRKTYEKIKDFLRTYPLLNTKSNSLVIGNYNYSSSQIADLYMREHPSKKKSESTIRTQRYNIGKIMYSILGADFKVYFYGSDERVPEYDSKLRDMRFVMDVLSDIGVENDVKPMPFFNFPIDTAPESYDIKDCGKELLFISKYSSAGFLSELEKIDMKKLNYIIGVLNEETYIRDRERKIYRDEKSFRKKAWGRLNDKKIELIKMLKKLTNTEEYSFFNAVIKKNRLEKLSKRYEQLVSKVKEKDKVLEELKRMKEV